MRVRERDGRGVAPASQFLQLAAEAVLGHLHAELFFERHDTGRVSARMGTLQLTGGPEPRVVGATRPPVRDSSTVLSARRRITSASALTRDAPRKGGMILCASVAPVGYFVQQREPRPLRFAPA